MTKYRCIGLLTHAYKTLSTLLLKRLLEDVENYLPESQSGFRKLRSTRDNVYLLATLMDFVLKSKKTCVITFIDFVAAFDSVSHKFLEKSLFEAGAGEKSRAMFRAIYRKATARVRVTTQQGEEVHSEKFPVRRGVIQGDIFSPLCFIVALEAIMRKHGGKGELDAFGELIDRLEYADDAALIDADSGKATERLSRLYAGALTDADMEISAPKTKAMFVRPRVDTGQITAQDYEARKQEFVCRYCERDFDSRHGLSIHEARWCKEARVEKYEEVYEVEEVTETRGSPDRRFYFVKWKGWPLEQGSWLHQRELQGAMDRVDDFWEKSSVPRSSTVSVAGEIRCADCNQQFSREQDRKSHWTRGCPGAVASRAGSRTEKAVQKQKQVEVQAGAGTVTMGEEKLENVFNFGYLGFGFQAEGDREGALTQRMAIARSRFGQLHEIWRSKKLPVSAKLRVFACAVVSVLTYGNEIWQMNSRVLKKLRGWNARCLATITGRGFREETVEPSFDLVARLRSRRLRWAGHILRQKETSLLRSVLLAQTEAGLVQGGQEEGGLLMDAPTFASTEDLLALAADRDGWREVVQSLLPASDPTADPKGPAGNSTLKQRPGLNNDKSGGLVNGKLRQVILPVSMFPAPPMSKA